MSAEVVILAGGAGTRLWPASDRARPKQFLSIPGDRTLLEQTYRRAVKIAGRDRTWIVTLKGQVAETRRVLPGLKAGRIIPEPVGRNSGPAVLTAAFQIEAVRKSPVTLLILPADHLIPECRGFSDSMRAGLSRAAEGRSLLTFGLKVTEPRTEYGYVEVAPGSFQGRVRKVKRFIEKPPLATAKRFARSGKHFWNSGMFCWRSDFFRAEMTRYCPEIHAPLAAMTWKGKGLPANLSRIYASLPNLSIDYALMERSRDVEVIPSSFAWSDVGTWSAVHEALPKDASRNAVLGRGHVVEGRGNLVFSKEKPAYLFGVDDLVVVQTPDATLVTTREKSRDLKRYLALLEYGKKR